MNLEVKLCSEINRAIRNKYPHTRGCFFHVSNERNSKNQAFIAKAIGIFAGVSDFLYIYKQENQNVPEGYLGFLALEVKVPGSYHKKEHLVNQINWGKTVNGLGGRWRLITSVEEAISCIEGNMQGYTAEQMECLLKKDNNKTLRIEKWKEE